VERAEQEVVARRARRLLWAFRIVFYGGAFLAAPALLGLGGEAKPPSLVDGSTSQGAGFTMEFEHGRPVSVDMGVSATCRPPLEWHVRWWSYAGKTARFRFDDGVLRVRDQLLRDYRDGWTGERNFTLEARVDDGRVSGTMRFVEKLSYGGRWDYVCESGDVTFFAEAG
jgi:hypothetical protein